MFCENGAKTVAVFSHPNHELAIFGLLQRVRPQLVYLSDGGDEERIAQTRRGLKSIGLLDHARFLNYQEKSFYDALLASDIGFYEEIAASLREVFESVRPEQVLCDAVEFYNPAHDMALPIVRAALRESDEVEVFEIPLIRQQTTAGGAYDIQRLPPSRSGEQIGVRLSPQELAAKLRARDEIYTILVDQIGPIIAEVPVEHFAFEVIAPARPSLPAPGADHSLRYERRARELLERGEIEHMITYSQHFLPIATSLLMSRRDAAHGKPNDDPRLP